MNTNLPSGRDVVAVLDALTSNPFAQVFVGLIALAVIARSLSWIIKAWKEK